MENKESLAANQGTVSQDLAQNMNSSWITGALDSSASACLRDALSSLVVKKLLDSF